MASDDGAALEGIDPAWNATTLNTKIAKPASAGIVAEDDGGMLGFILCHIVEGEAEILQITVREDARRRGIGRALLARFIAEFSPAVCVLEVRQDNPAAQRLYATAGFVVSGRRRGYYPALEDQESHHRCDALMMRLDTQQAAD